MTTTPSNKPPVGRRPGSGMPDRAEMVVAAPLLFVETLTNLAHERGESRNALLLQLLRKGLQQIRQEPPL